MSTPLLSAVLLRTSTWHLCSFHCTYADIHLASLLFSTVSFLTSTWHLRQCPLYYCSQPPGISATFHCINAYIHLASLLLFIGQMLTSPCHFSPTFHGTDADVHLATPLHSTVQMLTSTWHLCCCHLYYCSHPPGISATFLCIYTCTKAVLVTLY